jgi:hypothetical protein
MLLASTDRMSSDRGETRPARLESVRAIARVMDEAVRVPGTNIRFGLDALLGLVPGLGDVAGGLMSAYIVAAGARAGAPATVLMRMVGNVGIDMLVGAVPILGDLFDVGFKANSRNLALLERYADRPAETRSSSTAVVVGLVALILAMVAGGVWLAIKIVEALAGLIG